MKLIKSGNFAIGIGVCKDALHEFPKISYVNEQLKKKGSKKDCYDFGVLIACAAIYSAVIRPELSAELFNDLELLCISKHADFSVGYSVEIKRLHALMDCPETATEMKRKLTQVDNRIFWAQLRKLAQPSTCGLMSSLDKSYEEAFE